MSRFVRVSFAHLLDGRGVGELGIWCLDRLAFLERGNLDLYQTWVDTVEPTLPVVSGDPSPGGVTIVLGARRIQDASETLKSIDRQTHPDCRIVLSVPQSEFELASSLVTTRAKVEVLTGPASSSEEQLMLSALRAVETEYVLTLLPGAILAPNALLELHRVAIDGRADLVYSDEDRLRDGVRCEPVFKPCGSPDLQCASDYVGPVCLFRVASRLLDAPLSQSSVYRIVLDHLRADVVIRRVPRVLVHWKRERGSQPSQRKLPDVEEETNKSLRLLSPEHAGVVASIIVPTRDRLDLLRKCISSIYAHPHELTFEVLVLDNRSEELETLRWLETAGREWPGLKVLDADYEFNWSKLNNQGIDAAQGQVCVFLNNDVETISEAWLETLVGNALRSEIGAVGALLLYPDDTIQHAGMVLGIGGLAGHVYMGCPTSGQEGLSFVGPLSPRNVLAVTGACLAVERSKLSEMGGFDESFRICGDVDLCLRLHAAGYYNLYQPEAKLYHRESETRSRAPVPAIEKDRLLELFHTEIGAEDPFYNPNLNLLSRFPTFLPPFGLR